MAHEAPQALESPKFWFLLPKPLSPRDSQSLTVTGRQKPLKKRKQNPEAHFVPAFPVRSGQAASSQPCLYPSALRSLWFLLRGLLMNSG